MAESDEKRSDHELAVACAAWIAAKAWVVGLLVVTVICLDQIDVRSHPHSLTYVLSCVVFISCIALVLARRERIDIGPIHALAGAAVASCIGLCLCFTALLFAPVTNDIDYHFSSVFYWVFFVTPASAAVGMIRGVRARGSNPAVAVLCCAVLMSVYCLGAWALSRVPIGQISTGRTVSGHPIPYTPPQHDIAPLKGK